MVLAGVDSGMGAMKELVSDTDVGLSGDVSVDDG